MKKSLKVSILIAVITCIISISGSYAATNYAISATKIGYSDNSSLGATDVQAAIDGTCTKFSNQLTNLKENIIDTVYPVGSIYTSESDSTIDSVESRFKTFGKETKWKKYGEGKTLVGEGTGTDSTGTRQTFLVSNNSKNLGEYNHTLTIDEMPSHAHTTTVYWDVSHMEENFLTNLWIKGGKSVETTYGTSQPTNSTGGGLSHNNIQPYVTVYMYKRIK